MPAAYSLSPMPASQPATQPAATQPAAPVDLATWWRSLNDPTLNTLIEQSIQSNLDLRIATARVRESRALRDVSVSAFFPQVNATGSYAYRGSSLNSAPKPRVSRPGLLRSLLPNVGLRPATLNPATGVITPPFLTVNGAPITGGTNTAIPIGSTVGTSGTGTGTTTGTTVVQRRDQNLFQAGFDASWEIDVFGRIRRSVEASEADLDAAIEARRNTLVTVLSEVALNYVQLRGLQRRLEIAYENIRIQQDTLDVTTDRLRAELGSELDVAQSRAQLETTRSAVPLLESSIRQSIYQLAVLLGEPPEELADKLDESAPIPPIPPQVPLGLPSELLRRRPDVREAERTLAAVTARIGVATADLFPTFLIGGNFGTSTADIRHFFDQRSFLWSVGPSVQWNIFQGGRTLANIEAERARQEQAMANYERVILIALQDVENSLVAYNSERVRYDSLASAVNASQRATLLSSELYTGGLTPFLNLLQAQASLFASQDQMIQSESSAITNLISLYKALGGGWETFEPGPPTTAPSK